MIGHLRQREAGTFRGLIGVALRTQHLTGAGEQVGRLGMDRKTTAQMQLGFVETPALPQGGG